MLFIQRWFHNVKALAVIIFKYCQERARSDDYYDKRLVAKIKEKIRVRKLRKHPEKARLNLESYCSYGVNKQGYFYKSGRKMYMKRDVFKYCKDKDIIIYFNMQDKCVGPYQVVRVDRDTLFLLSRFNRDFKVTR